MHQNGNGAPRNRLRARKTTYLGTEMRSRLEAHFAKELDDAGLVWDYEPKCFAGSYGQYLPDFVLGANGPKPMYIDVKPSFSAHALYRMASVIGESQRSAIVAVSWKDESNIEERWNIIGLCLCCGALHKIGWVPGASSCLLDWKKFNRIKGYADVLPLGGDAK